MSDRVAVVILEEAKADVAALPQPELIREALRLALRLRDEPYLGDRLREKSNVKVLAGAECRKVKFDRPDRSQTARPRYRYRLVYRIEPHEGAPGSIVVIAIGAKPKVYGQAAARAGRRLREQARLRVRRPKKS